MCVCGGGSNGVGICQSYFTVMYSEKQEVRKAFRIFAEINFCNAAYTEESKKSCWFNPKQNKSFKLEHTLNE